MQLNDYDVPRHKLKVAIATTFVAQDLSGETSASDSAHKGIKAKEITVSFSVTRDAPDVVSGFYRIAEAVDSNGDLVVYAITQDSANAANVRQVKFAGRIDQREDETHDQWLISFKLTEYLSVPEKNEQRQDTAAAAIPATEGETIAGAAPDTTEPESLTSFESVLKIIDDAVA